MFTRCLCVTLFLVPSLASAQEQVDIGPGVYWRWLIQWKDDTESNIRYDVQGFRDTGEFGEWGKTYFYWERDGSGNQAPPPPALRLSASSASKPALLDTNGDWKLDDRDRAHFDADGDYDLDIGDLNAVRNDFGLSTESDIDGSGAVDISDLNIVRNGFLRLDPFSIGLPPWEPHHVDWDDAMWLIGDVQDACVVLLDPRSVANPVVPCVEAVNTPEPSGILLSGIAMMALFCRNWSRFRRVLLVVLSLVPSVAEAGDQNPAEPVFIQGLYWRYLVEWQDDTEGSISYSFNGFRESGEYTVGGFLYDVPLDGVTPRVDPPPIQLSASNFDNIFKLDTNASFGLDENDRRRFDADGDFKIDVNDLNAIRNNFGSSSSADLDDSGTVGIDDLNIVRNEFGTAFPFHIKPAPWEPNNSDSWNWFYGEVLNDCVVLLDARNVEWPYQFVVPCDANAVPEPSAFALAGIAIMALSRREVSVGRRRGLSIQCISSYAVCPSAAKHRDSCHSNQ